MPAKSTYVFVSVFAALAAYLLLVDEPRQQTQRRARERVSRVLPGLDAGQVSAVTLRTPRGTARVARDAEDGWRVTAPVRDHANGPRVEDLLAELAALESDREIAGADAELEPFGLAEPELLVALEGPSQTLAVGAENPAGDGHYLRVGNGPVLLVKRADVTPLMLAPDDLRQPRLLAGAPWERLVAVEIFAPGAAPLRLEMEQARWWLRRPRAAEADAEAVGRLVEKLRWARASGFAEGDGGTSALAGGIGVVLEWGETVPSIRVELALEGQTVWARRSGREAVLSVPRDVWDAVQGTLEGLHRRKPLQVKARRVRGLNLTWGGAERRSYRKVDTRWQRAGVELAAGEAARLQEVLATLEGTVAEQVIDPVTDPARYGLNAPVGTIEVELTENPRQELTLGRTEGGLFAREGGSGPVYALPAKFAEPLAAIFIQQIE